MGKYNMQMSDRKENIQILHAAITAFDKCFSVLPWREKYSKCSRLNITFMKLDCLYSAYDSCESESQETVATFVNQDQVLWHHLL